MSKLQIAFLELMIVGGLGSILILAGIITNTLNRIRNQHCTKRVKAKVINHKFSNDGRMYPIVEYIVDDKSYKVKKKFRGIKRITVSKFPMNKKSEAYEDNRGWLTIKTGAISNPKQIANQLWPIGSEMKVYYNPHNPKKSYVDRPISETFTTIMFIIIGMVLIFIAGIIFSLMQL